jgi:hypothetical protein
MIGATLTVTGMPALVSSRMARNRPTGAEARGSIFWASSASSVTSVIVTRPAFISARRDQRSVSRSTMALLVMVVTGWPHSAMTSRHWRAMRILCSMG